MTGILDDVEPVPVGGALEQRLAVREGEGHSEPARDDHLHRLGKKLPHQVEGVEAKHRPEARG